MIKTRSRAVAEQPKWGTDKIVGRGKHGEPVNIAQILWIALEEADEEWQRQEDQPDEENAGMLPTDREMYNQARLIGCLGAIVSTFRGIREQNNAST